MSNKKQSWALQTTTNRQSDQCNGSKRDNKFIGQTTASGVNLGEPASLVRTAVRSEPTALEPHELNTECITEEDRIAAPAAGTDAAEPLLPGEDAARSAESFFRHFRRCFSSVANSENGIWQNLHW